MLSLEIVMFCCTVIVYIKYFNVIYVSLQRKSAISEVALYVFRCSDNLSAELIGLVLINVLICVRMYITCSVYLPMRNSLDAHSCLATSMGKTQTECEDYMRIPENGRTFHVTVGRI